MKTFFYGLIGLLALAASNAELTAQAIQREANETLQMPEEPPRFGFQTVRAFGRPRADVNFTDPTGIVTAPGETNRVFVLERDGRIGVITNLVQPNRTTFLDIAQRTRAGGEEGLLGMAFHPEYETNRYFFVFYTTTVNGQRHDRLSRFEISPENPNQALSDSEVPLISQPDEAGNHNGGDLHFGPDGYLYVALGDEGAGNDDLNNSQRIDKDFFSGILRIDIDQRPGNLAPNPHPAVVGPYSVPADNPFVGATEFNDRPVDPDEVRTEFWAVGLRNPWRMAFDPVTGRLYCGDVGQTAREEIDLIEKGGNYGWNYREGFIEGPDANEAPPGFDPVEPIHDYPRSEGQSVTGGVVYRGQRFSQISGAYIFADFVSGTIWALRHQGNETTSVEAIASDSGISGFGIDPSNGDVLMANLDENTIKRLVYGDQIGGEPLPETLADTGAFSDVENLTPETGIVPYDLNLPFWSDTAKKTRWFSLPDPQMKMTFNREGNWDTPAGSVWIKHFDLQLTNGVPESTRRLETRFIVRQEEGEGVYGATYRWGDSMTNAQLVPEQGMDEEFVIYNQEGDVIRTQTWHYPSRHECVACHTEQGGFALGFNSPQMNREMKYGDGEPVNQILALSEAGYFQEAVSNHHTLPALVKPTNESHSLEYRVRSYLAVNCSQCHQPDGSGLGMFDTAFDTPTSEAGLINGPLNNPGDSSENRVVQPGSLEHSMLYRRINTLGEGRMPPLDSNVLDTNAVNLLGAWITEGLADYQTYAQWRETKFGNTTSQEGEPQSDPDGDGALNRLEFLVKDDPNLADESWRISVTTGEEMVQIRFPQVANRGFQVEAVSDLTEPLSWSPLNVPGNRPFFSSTNFEAVVEEPLDGEAAQRFYRVRVFDF